MMARFKFVESDIFGSLIQARLELEHKGFLLCCQGARPNVFPSGMLKQMNDGRVAHALDHPLSEDGGVDCFADADPSEVGTVEQQRQFVFDFFGLRLRDAHHEIVVMCGGFGGDRSACRNSDNYDATLDTATGAFSKWTGSSTIRWSWHHPGDSRRWCATALLRRCRLSARARAFV
jgi:hypothetical protein